MALQSEKRMTAEEYLRMERETPGKRDFLNGEVFDMTGGSRAHNLIAGNIFASFHRQLRRREPCEVYMNDMRVKVEFGELYTYPDIVVACESPEMEDEHFDTLLNPQVIVEVLSPSTEAYDRGLKFEHFRSLQSLRDYLLVHQNKVHVEHFVRREGNQWVLSERRKSSDTIEIDSVGCQLNLAEVYEKTNLPE
ncbi:MAG: Uma2 family endonuclease [Thermodesulfobacteriota bacterium]